MRGDPDRRIPPARTAGGGNTFEARCAGGRPGSIEGVRTDGSGRSGTPDVNSTD